MEGNHWLRHAPNAAWRSSHDELRTLTGKIEFDHVLAIALGGSNSIDNFEAVHAKPCHQARTRVTVGMKSKADRQRAFQETGHGYQHKRKPWSWLTFGGRRKQSGGAK